MKQFHMLAGLPRSGSTLLSSILQQNPNVHASQNSVLLTLLYFIKDKYLTEEQTQAYFVKNQLQTTMNYAAHGFYAHINKPIIIDKSRAWPFNFDVAIDAFGNPKMVATVRSIPDILASFNNLAEKNPNNYIDKNLIKNGKLVNVENRCEWLVQSGGTVFESWKSLKHGYDKYYKDMIIIEYDDITIYPYETMKQIYSFLNLPYFEHDFYNIINHTPENDDVYGIKGMHEIRQKLSKSSNSAIDILGKTLYTKYSGGEFWRQ